MSTHGYGVKIKQSKRYSCLDTSGMNLNEMQVADGMAEVRRVNVRSDKYGFFTFFFF